jgi:nucleotide-binding universal stress UspA family protein
VSAEHAPHSQPSSVRTILVPTDFSKPSRHAVRAAVALARAYKAKLILLNVQSWNQYIWNESPAGYYESEMALRDYAQRRMTNLGAELVGVDHECQTVDGNPVDEIIKAADSAECQLIVMGTHGSRGLGRLLFGSVAEGVMRKANCPVLALRSPALFAVEDSGARLAASSPAAPDPTCQGGCREEPDPGPIVVSNHVSCTGGAGVQAHHRAFPEVVGEGTTIEEAASRLIALFDRVRQHDGGEWRRASIEDAFLAVKQYRSSLGGPRRPGAAPPRRDVP